MADLFSAPPTNRPSAVSRTSQRRHQKASAAARRRRRRRIVVLFLALVAVGGAGWFVYNHVLPGLSFGSLHPKVEDYAGPGAGSAGGHGQPG